MRMYDIILKKRDGLELSKKEIDFVINGFTKDIIPDYQISSLLMSIFFNKMNYEETIHLTRAIMNSGDILDLKDIDGIIVDKHSTGGVGDTTTLVLGPMVAACGVSVAKMSGRGLGHTGGTIDKLESFKGFNVEIEKDTFINSVNNIGIAIAGQTGVLAPADKKLYALRDVTATVDNLSLIASSIMSKKLAAGSNAIVLDVKTGNGAFMKDIGDSFELAKLMVNIGESMGRKVSAIISDMNEPLGRAVGNAIEVKEAIDTLKGNGPEDLYELCLTLGSQLLLLAKITDSSEKATELLDNSVKNGKALNKFKEFINNQGGDIEQINNTDLLPSSKFKLELKSKTEGYISHINTEEVGTSALNLGAGRETKDSKIDLGVGIYLNKKVGDKVINGEGIATIHANNMEKAKESLKRLTKCYTISEVKMEKKKLIYGIVTKDIIKKF